MNLLPQEVCQAWEKRNGAIVLTTVAEDKTPNSIYATCVGLYQNSYIVVADNYFCKTQANILQGSPGSVLFITEDSKAYQVKGTIEYYTTGPYFDFMKQWNPERHPGKAAAVLVPSEVYSGAKKLL